MKHIKITAAIVVASFFPLMDIHAQSTLQTEATAQTLPENEHDADADGDADFNRAVTTPAIPKKSAAAVRAAMKQVAENLYRQGYEIETMRGGEVVIAVIPSDDLFYPNEDMLMKRAEKILEPFCGYIGDGDRYKIVLAAHTDDTGSEKYCSELGENRIYSLLEFFEGKGYNIDAVQGYSFGSSKPITDNESRASRAKNRRIEIYIVPLR